MATTGTAEDPFNGILERSAIAQTLRDARASLARPSRPYTPASRSLFQGAADDTYTLPRPSSSYSIDQLRFVRDTFAPSSSCGSLGSRSAGSAPTRPPSGRSLSRSGSASGSRSGSRGSSRRGSGGPGRPPRADGRVSSAAAAAAAAAQAELFAVPELEETEPEVEQLPAFPPDVVTFGDGGEIVADSHGQAAEFTIQDPAFAAGDEEYDAGCGADDLALCMSVPPPCSDEESGGEDGERPAAKPPCSRQKQPQQSPPGSGELSPVAQAASDLEALAAAAAEGDEAALAARLLDAAAVARAAAAGARSGGGDEEAPRLLRAVLVLMGAKVDAKCLLRLARCAVELLQVGTVVAEVRARGVQAAYLNIARALFKLSKDANNDALFREEGLLESLLLMLGEVGGVADAADAGASSAELRVFLVGVLKNVSHNEDNQKHIVRCGALPALLMLLRPEGGLTGSSHEAQLLIQVAALLRNLASSGQPQRSLVDLGAFEALAGVSAAFPGNVELQVNVARVFARLSNDDAACHALEADPAPLQQAVCCLREHPGNAALVLRLAFALGNLTATSDALRCTLIMDCDLAGVLPALLERYWKQDRQMASAGADTLQAALQENEGVLVKLVRLAANASINASVGGLLASEPAVVSTLLEVLQSKCMQDSEELVLSTMAAATNLLYYDAPTNLLFTASNKQVLCHALRPMLVESYNVEALVETARALGNLSRHPDARRCIAELRIDEALATLIQHSDRDLVFYSCGALVNVAADPRAGTRLVAGGLAEKLSALLHGSPAEDVELRLVAVKVLSNLAFAIESDGRESWPDDALRAARDAALLARDGAMAAVTAAGGGHSTQEALVELAQRLADTLPPSSPQGGDMDLAHLCAGQPVAITA